MSLWKIAWRSIQQRSLSSTLTALSMALGVALVVAVLVTYGVVKNSFARNAAGYHLILGAKGSPLQLVLNSVFHLSQPIENVPYSFYQEFKTGRYAPMVAAAIPCCMGDNYEGFRVVGTTPEMFEELEYAPGMKYEFEPGGRNFEADHFFEGVIGSYVARQTGLKVGDDFNPTHGIAVEAGMGHDHEAFKIVGILKPTGTANDRALFVNMEGFYLLDGHAKPMPRGEASEAHTHDDHSQGHDHDHAQDDEHDHAADHDHDHDHDDGHANGHHHDHDHGHGDHDHHHAHHEPLPESQREVTAILLKLKNDLYAMQINKQVNEGQIAQAVFPIREVTRLFNVFVFPIQMLLLGLAILVVLVASIGIMVSIYNSMSDRRREIGVMRALGARRRTVMTTILLESIMLSLLGGIGGLLLGHGLIVLFRPMIIARAGVPIGLLQFEPIELVLIPGLAILASLVGLLPAWAAYRTDVDKALTNNP